MSDFKEILPAGGSPINADRRMERQRQTDIMKVIGGFLDHAEAPKNQLLLINDTEGERYKIESVRAVKNNHPLF